MHVSALHQPRSVAESIRALRYENPEVRLEAVRELRTADPQAEGLAPALVRALKDSDSWVRIEAAQALVRLGGQEEVVVPFLIEALDGGSQHDRMTAADALTRAGRGAVPFLLAALRDPDRDLRRRADDALKQAGGREGALSPRDRALLEDAKGHVRMHAARLLGALGGGEEVAAALAGALGDTSGHVRSWAAVGLRRAGGSPALVIPALTDALGDPDPDVGVEAALSLWAVGGPVELALPVLTEALRDTGRRDRVRIATALGRIGGPAIDRLVAAARDTDGTVRCQAIKSLSRAAGDREDVLIPALRVAFVDPDLDVRRVSTEALVRLGVPAVPALGSLLADPDPEVRLRAARALGDMVGACGAVAPLLVAALGDDNRPVRRECVAGLVCFGLAAAPALLDGLRSPVERVRAEAVQIVARVAPDALPLGASHGESPRPEASAEDERIVVWFGQIDLADHLRRLQVFWCVGVVDRPAIESGGIAMGYKKLAAELKARTPRVRGVPLPTSIGYIRESCLEALAGLFNCKPFSPEAWSPHERVPDLRAEEVVAGKDCGRWTPRAGAALRYVTRFLTLRGLLPEMADATRPASKRET